MQGDDPASIHSRFQEAFNAGDIDSLVALYEPNAVLVVNGQSLVGHASIRAAYEGFLARRGRMTLKTRFVVRFEETLAVLHGDWVLEGRGTQEGGSNRGLSIEVVRRQPDGSWRFIIDNPNTPQAAG
jgi:uncharacterized protein (TIGR02246 family)